MSKSRLFRFVQNVGVVGSLGGVACLSAMAEDKRYLEFQKEHPNAVVRRDFQYVPQFGGYWKLSVDESATQLKNSQPKYNR